MKNDGYCSYFISWKRTLYLEFVAFRELLKSKAKFILKYHQLRLKEEEKVVSFNGRLGHEIR